ncbi:MAG: Tyrosine recombinase XerD [Pelotomaculum sp. PtaU1.Bin065]|nr:MAG: Tyrosine recombinase XerD [Pelotomaculum sp. PtaU1.Bin065]
MEKSLIQVNQSVELRTAASKAHDYIAQAKAKNTIKSYRADWQDFTTWCNNNNLIELPADPETVAVYLAHLAETSKVSTLQRRISAISQAHQAAGHPSPTCTMEVRAVMAGIRRERGSAQAGKAPVLVDDIKAMVDTLPDNLIGIRDRALLLLGFAGAFRRSELISLDVEDIEFSREGITVTLRKSKTDQEGHGRKIGIPYGSNIDTCPVRSLQAWLEGSGINEGPLFRSINRHGSLQQGRLSDKAVALVVKRTTEAAGLDPVMYSGHSLRAGLATSAAMAGVSERAIMNQTGHRSVSMVRKYIREGSLFRDNAAAGLGL